jgi:hypothetical protein
VYLLLFHKLEASEVEWLVKYAIPVAPLAWIHNAEIKGTRAVPLGSKALRALSQEIADSAEIYFSYVEEKIRTNSLRGSSKRLAINKIRVIESICSDLELISYAKDLLCILEGEEKTHQSDPPKNKKSTNLGLDNDTVENYLLELAKKPTIH